jgi:hypothetical protein
LRLHGRCRHVLLHVLHAARLLLWIKATHHVSFAFAFDLYALLGLSTNS